MFTVDIHHEPTNLVPGGTGDIRFDLANQGDAASAGPLKLRIILPDGITSDSIRQVEGPAWSCTSEPGDHLVSCTSADPIPRHTVARGLLLRVAIDPDAAGKRTIRARLEGGGATGVAGASELALISSQPAPFGIVPGSFSAGAFASDGSTPVVGAGLHPAQVIIGFDLNTVVTGPADEPRIAAVDAVRNLQVLLPPGLVGNLTAMGGCAPAALTSGECPPASQVGRVDFSTGPFSLDGAPRASSLPIFNMEAPRGVLADLAFVMLGNPVHLRIAPDPGDAYALVVRADNINETESLLDLKVTLWGVPADHAHDSERCGVSGAENLDTSGECPTGTVSKAFLNMPSRCGAAEEFVLRGVESWQQQGPLAPAISQLAAPTSDCGRPAFEPAFSAAPSVIDADSPTGLDLRITVPQTDDPNAPATPAVKDLSISLPTGSRISPSFADGLQSCASDQIGLRTSAPVACPDASRLAAVEVTAPSLGEPLQGSLYLGSMGQDPAAPSFSLYLVVADTGDRGLLFKLPGDLELDPVDGRITFSFANLPPLPFERFEISLRGGQHAPLISAADCGAQVISATATSWAQPADPVSMSDRQQIDAGPGGASCSSTRPFSPRLSAGTLSPVAGKSTSLILRVVRSDHEQEISYLSAALPPGLLADIEGVPACGREGVPGIIRPATARCSSASLLGSVTVASGAGPDPLLLSGRVYLAGPYRGAPYSVLIDIPAAAGPLDLGALVSRLAVEVDPKNARLRLVSDPFPTLLSGIPIDLRSIRIELDRPGLIHNPTSCEETSFTGAATSEQGVFAPLADRFQVGRCSALRFRPKVSIGLDGGVARNGHPRFRLALGGRPGDANIEAAAVTLPAGQLLDIRHMHALCRPSPAAESCPETARVGFARLRSPLLPGPLQGPIYLGAPSHRYPDLVADLSGSNGLRLELRGRTAPARGGRLSLRFSGLPDLPLTQASVSLTGGRGGIFVNSEELCSRPRRATVNLGAQNGKQRIYRPKISLRGSC